MNDTAERTATQRWVEAAARSAVAGNSRHSSRAMAMSTPRASWISTAISGVPEIISDGIEGRLVEPDNPADLAAALGGLLASAESARHRAAHRRRQRVIRRRH